MGNQTSQPEFSLLGLSDLTSSRIPLVLLFLLIYVVTMVGNLLIIILVSTDSHLKTPMYFFLGNLSILDIATPSIPASHLPLDIFPGKKIILYSTCVSQVFFFICLAYTEVLLLAVMSYDRYVAICHPLHYTTIISVYLCIQLAVSTWVFGSLLSLMHTLCTLRLSYCEAITIQGLFCELYEMIRLSCSDTYLNNLLVSVSLSYGVILVSIKLLFYGRIFKAIQRIRMKDGRLKALSTCSSHLMVVSLFYGTSVFNYINPNMIAFSAGRLLSAVYTLLTPFLNPVIYSLRNKELQSALHRVLIRLGFIKT